MFRKTLDLIDTEIKFVGEKGKFQGYASVFEGVDSYGDTIKAGAFQNAIKYGKLPKMFENHKSWELPIGKWVSITEDSKGLLVEGEFTPNHMRAETVRAAMQHGTVDGLSIGFRMKEGDYEMEGANRTIKNISDLVEISVVTFPADDAARVDLTSVKSVLDTIGTIKDLEDFLRDSGGFSKALSQAVIARSKVIFTGEPLPALDEKATKELNRLLGITL
jgi:HK97 family phage prohead protease